MMIALPLLLIHVTVSQRRRRATGSMPVDGSSRKTTEGFPIRAIAVFNLRLSPPLNHQRRGEKVEEKEKKSTHNKSLFHRKQLVHIYRMLIWYELQSSRPKSRCIYQLIFIKMIFFVIYFSVIIGIIFLFWKDEELYEDRNEDSLFEMQRLMFAKC